MRMSVRDAITIAKDWVREALSEEKVSNLGVEEIKSEGQAWKITVGFSRPWDANTAIFSLGTAQPPMRRSFKVLTIDDQTGEVLNMINREN